MVVRKKFIELNSGKIFQVIDQFEDIAILDNRAKVKVNNLLDKNLYEEYIDPNLFFKNEGLVSAFTEKIKQIPLDENYRKKLDDFDQEPAYRPSLSEPAVLPYDPEEEKRELLEKAKRMFDNQRPNAREQFERFSNLIEEDSELPIINPEPARVEISPDPTVSSYQDKQIEIKENNNNNYSQPMDPIISMFKNVKRNTDFNISFSVSHKIPRLDFIEMMEDSYNTSIIEFLAEEFTNEILLNPEMIKRKIVEEIRQMVYGSETEELNEPTPKVTKNTKKTEVNND